MENKFKFLTKHSLKKKIKNKWFLIANIIVALVAIALVNIDSIVTMFGGDFNKPLTINVVDNTGYYETIKSGLKGVEGYLGTSKLKVTKSDDLKNAKKKLKDTKDILLVINSDNKNVYNVEFITDAYVDTVKYQAIISSLNATKQSIALDLSGFDKEKLNQISSAVEVKRSFISEEKTEDEENTRTFLSLASLVIALPCFMLIMYLVQMIGAEINEEKSTRGMEIIIGNVSPKTHFFSKILSSNLFVLIQGVLLLIYSGVGLIIRKLTVVSSNKGMEALKEAADSLDLSGVLEMIEKSGIISKLGYIIPLIMILLLLSFLAYSLLAGILASMTTNMENYQQLQTPLMVVSLAGFYLIIISAMFPGAVFVKIASVIPLMSISLAPSLLLSGEIGVGLIIVAIVLLMILNFVLIKFGLKIYKVGILNYSETNLWKKMFKAIKEK